MSGNLFLRVFVFMSTAHQFTAVTEHGKLVCRETVQSEQESSEPIQEEAA